MNKNFHRWQRKAGFLILALLSLPGYTGEQSDSTFLFSDRVENPAIQKAMHSVLEAVATAKQDPERPVYHFRPPANWMNDPNGTIFYKGYYHVFYQHNPYGDQWGHMHWGHTRSMDLVYWEHLPIALAPSLDQGEDHCFSGCAWVNPKDELMLFYTSVSARENARPHEQWAALPLDDELINWEKHEGNPILTLKTHGGPELGGSWRDPFLVEEQGRTFMVIGADTEDRAVIPIYEARNAELTEWIMGNPLQPAKE